jgi:hypothetical protein
MEPYFYHAQGQVRPDHTVALELSVEAFTDPEQH